MSRVTFRDESGAADLSGAERAYAGNWCREILVSALWPAWDTLGHDRPPILRWLPPDHYLQRQDPLRRDHISPILSGIAINNAGHSIEMTIEGVTLDPFVLGLNTAIAIGGDALRLLARLHGQCEIHGYIEEKHRAWLADVIREGRYRSKLLRPAQGWDEVEAFLRAGSGPVVTSYSVCDSFPSAEALAPDHPARESEEAAEEWQALSFARRWADGLVGLRARSSELRRTGDTGLEWSPTTWGEFFAPGWTAFSCLHTMTQE